MPYSRPRISAIGVLNRCRTKRAADMITLDRFFDRYDRVAGRWLSDLLVTALLAAPLLYAIL